MARQKKFLPQSISWVIGWRVALFLLALLAGDWLVYQPSFPYADELLNNQGLPHWLTAWSGFDGVHYLTIATKGYLGIGLIQAFFPGWPLILRVLPQPLISGLLLNLIMMVGLVWLFNKLITLDESTKIARWSIIALLVFPTSLFFGALYTEVLFLFLVLAGFYAARQQRWWLAGLLAALASGTRIVGVFLWPALLLELWQQQQPTSLQHFLSHHWQKLLGVSLALGGVTAYMMYLNNVFGDPFYFLHVQEEFGAGRQEQLILLPQVIWRSLKILITARPFDWKYFSYLQDLVLSLGALTTLVAFYKKIRPSYLLFSALAFLLPTVTGTFSSMPRYILVIFPLYILLGKLFVQKPLWRTFLLTVSAILLIINTILFVQGYWVA